MTRTGRPAPPPDEASLHEAALAHLARYGGSEAGLRRVLERRIARWARSAAIADPERLAQAVGAARQAASAVVARLAASGAVNDAEFATVRARRLARSGRSRRAILAHLGERGVAGEVARASLPDAEESELAAAVATSRRRRIGPFRTGEVDQETRRRDLAALARAGFSQEIARRAIAMPVEAAESLLIRLRNG